MIVLASKSPRRKEILEEILGDIPFICVPSDFDETTIKSKSIEDLTLNEARGKGSKVASSYKDDVVISCDTMVFYKGEKLGKPKDEDDVYRMLRLITGNIHQVVSSYCIFVGGKEIKNRVCKADVYLEKMSDVEISMYIDTRSPFDKAGAYGIQDEDFISSKVLKGSYYTIMGLPKEDLEEDLISLHLL